MKPLVSIVIPAYNSADAIGWCVQSALAQACSEFDVEVIVVDNGSTDATQEVAKTYPVKCVVEKRRGHAAARNRGAREATGSIIAFLDADCVAPPTWISTARRALDRPWIGAAQARLRRHGQPASTKAFVQGYYYAPFMSTASLVVTREAFMNARGFDDDLHRNVDIDFIFRLLANGYALAWLPEPVVVYYHYLPRTRAWHRGLEGGRADSQIENRWQALVGHKPKRRRYHHRLRGMLKILMRSAMNSDSPTHLVGIEQLGKLVSYVQAEVLGIRVSSVAYTPVTPLPEVLGERRYLILSEDRAIIFDAAAEAREDLDATATRALRTRIDEAWTEMAKPQ